MTDLVVTSAVGDLAELHQLCREGRLYEVEAWIRKGRPLQLTPEAERSQHYKSALQIALETGQHSLSLLLLRSGYRPDLEGDSPFDAALRNRRTDLIDLLFDFGVDPHQVSLWALFGTYDRTLFGALPGRGCGSDQRLGIGGDAGQSHLEQAVVQFCQEEQTGDIRGTDAAGHGADGARPPEESSAPIGFVQTKGGPDIPALRRARLKPAPRLDLRKSIRKGFFRYLGVASCLCSEPISF